jgi:superfamily II DNA helicase RecQ
VFEKALEKLWTHGGAVVDSGDYVTAGSGEWRDSYIAQGEQKRAQIERMIRYAQSNECRMGSLVRHFGDVADGRKNCGICDFCAPAACIAQRYRQPTDAEIRMAFDILDELEEAPRSVGKLHAQLCAKGEASRDDFEELVGSLARAGLVRLTEETFEKDGKSIPYRKAWLAREANFVSRDGPLEFTVRRMGTVLETPGRRSGARKKSAKKKRERIPLSRPAGRAKGEAAAPVAGSPLELKAEELLRAWRLATAKRLGVPAFRIMTDKVLEAIAKRRPKTAADLLAIPGIGINSVEKYGAQIYRILNEAAK